MVVNDAFQGQFDQFPSENAAHISAIALGYVPFHHRKYINSENGIVAKLHSRLFRTGSNLVEKLYSNAFASDATPASVFCAKRFRKLIIAGTRWLMKKSFSFEENLSPKPVVSLILKMKLKSSCLLLSSTANLASAGKQLFFSKPMSTILSTA